MLQIYYFGGYAATEDNVRAWADSVYKKVSPSQTLMVAPFPYPKNASAGNPLPQWEEQFGGSRAMAKRIADAASLLESVTIIAHSSGCKIGNDVANELLNLGHDSFRLIALDGFCPAPKLLALEKTRVWSARNDDAEVVSLNFFSCKEKAGSRFKSFNTDQVERWPLHFSLVNLNADDDYPGITQGYHNCDANLTVLGL